jgi:predicted permease
LLTPEDDKTPGAHAVVVLAHHYWTERFQQNPQVLNQALLVNGVLMTVVGVAPRDFRGITLGQNPSVFVPISMREALTPRWKGLENRRNYWIYLFARLKPGVTFGQAEAAMNVVYKPIIKDIDLPLQKGASDRYLKQFTEQTMKLEPGDRGQSSMLTEGRTPLLLLLAITGFVLLIACANIANLLLARSAARSKEFSIRISVGASRTQLIRQLMTESLVLSLTAGLAGLIVAYWTNSLLISYLPSDAGPIFSPNLNATTLAFALGLSIIAGFLFGLFPAVHSTRDSVAAVMKDQAGNVSASSGAAWFRRSLVTAQVALSLLLLISAGLFLKSLVKIMRVDLGIKTENTIVFGLSPQLNQYSPERTRALFEKLEQSISSLPGVTHVAASMVPLIAGNNWGNNVSVDGFEPGPDTDTHSMYNEVGPGFFRTLGVPLVAGREFTDSDGINAPKVAIVNEAFVRKFSANSSAIGKRMQQGAGGKNDIEIVGIVKDAKYSGVKQAVPALYYVPYRQNKDLGSLSYYVKTSIPPQQIMPQIRRAVAEVDSNLPIEELKTLEKQVDENIAVDRMISTLAASFAALATLLAAVGLYGVLAYTVARRTREIGIRLAIGAQPNAIRRLVMKEVLWMIAIGTAIGLPAAFGLAKFSESLLYELKGSDPWVHAGATLLVVAISLVAAYIPIRRAMAVDPLAALRYE